MTSDHGGTEVPLQRRPDAPTLDGLRWEVQTLHGVLLHQAHIADGCAATGDAASRSHWRAVAGTHRQDAEQVARLLGIGETAVA